MITTTNDGWELYVYMNGVLIYKRWLKHNYGRMFYEREGIRENRKMSK